jgi:hypothetical protein
VSQLRRSITRPPTIAARPDGVKRGSVEELRLVRAEDRARPRRDRAHLKLSHSRYLLDVTPAAGGHERRTIAALDRDREPGLTIVRERR